MFPFGRATYGPGNEPTQHNINRVQLVYRGYTLSRCASGAAYVNCGHLMNNFSLINYDKNVEIMSSDGESNEGLRSIYEQKMQKLWAIV